MARQPHTPAPPRRFADLRLRLISGIAVAALALLCIWLGGIWLALLTVLAVLAMTLEWRSITAHRGGSAAFDAVPFALATVGAALALHFAGAWLAAALLLLLAGVGFAIDARGGRSHVGGWSVLGTVYIGLAGMALIALRSFEPFGFLMILWAALVVVAADVGGYFAGRMIGGPKLWPALSPNKTWAGMIGGVVLAALVGLVFSWATVGTYFLQVCTVSAVAALLSQAGDLGESALKRRFGVKDASSLIPGHGGVLDRLDGHMAAILVAAAVTFWREQAVFVW